MIEQISAFFNIEMIYLWLNFGVIPFWVTLIFFPQSKVCNFIVTSIFPFFILSIIYSYLLYLFYKKDLCILARSGFDFETSKRVIDIDKEEYLKIINLL